MATYAIGDVQGCYDSLLALLDKIHFNERTDTLWFAGDLINRGPASLQVLRFVKNLPRAITVLGNHDIHLLALYYGVHYTDHTLHTVLKASDCDELIAWLRQQPFLHHDPFFQVALCHAGIYPRWTLTQAKQYAAELSTILQNENLATLLPQLYGNEPTQWQAQLVGIPRWRFILNAFTRMRFCSPTGELNFNETGKPGSQAPALLPWYEFPMRPCQDLAILFGHWAALAGQTTSPTALALDTGCVWGKTLTALRLDDRQLFQVKSVN